MGNGASIDIVALIFGCWDRCFKRATSLCQLEKYFENLKKQRNELVAKREDIDQRIRIEEGRHMEQLREVEVWRTRVNATIAEADKLISTGPQEIKKLCLGGCCSKNCVSSVTFERTVIEMLDEMDKLYSRNFDRVAQQQPAVVQAEIPGDQPVGLEIICDKVWRCLLEENIGIVGLWGMGGVGKTTLVKQIYRKFSATRKDFKLIWVKVSKDFSVEKVQDEIEKRLGVCSDEQWKMKSHDEKAVSIYNTLLKKKFVLILDDIWQPIDLEKVGVPRPNKKSESKIVFTTRLEDVCGNMRAKRIIKVDPLAPKNAWQLFQDNVDEAVLKITGVLPIAKDVVKECGGLPLALITISRVMARKKTLQEWRYALEILRNAASNLEGMDRVLSLLKFSYDYLPSDTARSCFLYCSLFPEDYKIEKDDLIDYLICEELIKTEDDEIDLRNKGYNDVGNLVRACLLEEEGEYVKMHDVIRDMALWIARNHEVPREKFFVKTGARLNEVPRMGEWQGVKRMSLVGNKIEKIDKVVPVCQNLSTLFLSSNPLVKICDGFFQFMNALTSLDLSRTGLMELPLGITKLASLQYLNLSYTDIKELSLELNKLVKLIYLNIEGTRKLDKIPRTLISSLKLLQILRMYECNYFKDIKQEDSEVLVEELQRLAHLKVLSITVHDPAALQQLASRIHVLQLWNLKGAECLDISFLTEMKYLDVYGCDSLEEFNVISMMEAGAEATSSLYTSTIVTDRSFNIVQEVIISHCQQLLHLTWLSLAPNLRSLQVIGCRKITEIIRELQKIPEADGNRNLFGKLEVLDLRDAPNLTSIYGNALPFPSLESIRVVSCPSLKSLPLNSNSAKDCKLVIQGEESWWKNVDWEDEAAKSTFLPCFETYLSLF